MNKTDKWQIIERVADDMGIRPGTLRQWKNRGIPFWAHIQIVQRTAGKISADDLMKTRDKNLRRGSPGPA